jgi:isopenicillin-N epimerase
VSALSARCIDTLVDGAHAPGMVPVELDALGAAYWTGNGHKWLCGPKGTAVLWVREDRREPIHPLVVSHGANAVLGDRTRFRHEFDWVGTADPTGYLTLPSAIDWMAQQAPGGWPEVMASNRALALDGRDRVCQALGIEPPAPDSMVGAMATLLLPWVEADDAAAERFHDRLEAEARIQVPVGLWPVPAARTETVRPQLFMRISAQRYNEPADYDKLAEALVRMR